MKTFIFSMFYFFLTSSALAAPVEGSVVTESEVTKEEPQSPRGGAIAEAGQLISKKDSLPPCCSGNRSSDSCKNKAADFMSGFMKTNADYNVGYVNKIRKAKIRNILFKSGSMTMNNFKPRGFWNIYCDGFGSPSAYKTSAKKAYKNGFITFHDAQFGAKFFDNPENKGKKQQFNAFYEKAQADFAKLFGVNYKDLGNSFQDRVMKDRINKAYADYVNKIFNGWSDAGYHFVVGRNSGVVMPARDLKYRGAHAGGSLPHSRGKISPNWHNIGVSIGGNAKEYGLNATAKKAAKSFVNGLQEKFNISSRRVVTHNHWKDTSCCVGVINNFVGNTWNSSISDQTRAANVSPSERKRRLDQVYKRRQTGR